MKRKITWYLVIALILGLTLLAISCGGGTTTTPNTPDTTPPADETPPAEEPTETAGPPAIPHTLEGRDDCLVCHGESGIKPFPANHAGRTNDMCRGCHQPAG
ncbi:MAG: hypothetical protein Q8O55_03155 [Dehalococcoidales bacterium]|nr:hypothetical protein [Dehalococcoidales bacterium]MDZ4246123.1 hypothetical protein [Dehalococcoidia bacterium]